MCVQLVAAPHVRMDMQLLLGLGPTPRVGIGLYRAFHVDEALAASPQKKSMELDLKPLALN